MVIIDKFSDIFKSISRIFRRIVGTRNERMIKKLRPVANAVDGAEGDYSHLTDEQLLEEANRFGEKILPLVTEFEAPYRKLSREQNRERFKEHRKGVEKLDQRIADEFFTEASALVREASRRAQNHRHFHCQIIGGRVLYDGVIAEMKTGEGKTIVCHVAAFLKVLQGKHVHILTANDYLVKRDAEFAEPIFAMLGMSVGHIQSQMDPGGREGTRKAAYQCDITYGTNSEFGFDYLRDNMKQSLAEQVQSTRDYAIIDEVDSILIDEARTPLIISGPADDDVTRYPRADKVAADMVREQSKWDRRLPDLTARFDGDTQNIQKLDDAMRMLGWREKEGGGKTAEVEDGAEAEEAAVLGALGPDFLTDDHADALRMYDEIVLGTPNDKSYRRLFIVQKDRKQVGITHDGVTFAQEALGIGSLYAGANVQWPHLIENALRAHKVYQRDKDYVVQDGTVVIVDPFTGRLMPGRQWSDGLHQACEAREGVRIKQETQTLATITVQNYAHLYDKIAGMTGTAATEASEFMKIYGLDVIEVPTNRPVNRMDYNDKVMRDIDEKYKAIVEEIHEVRRRGRPADPFVIADCLAALRPVHKKLNRDTDRIDAALASFNSAEIGDQKVIDFMLEVYDEQMGDLATGRPVLVGTTSVENSEKLGRMLDRTYGIEHEVLNAKNHTREAEIITKAGFRTVSSRGGKKPLGNVTIATNMAGRGTDIKLEQGVVFPTCKVTADESSTAGSSNDSSVSLPVIGTELYPPGSTKCCILCDEYDPSTNCAHCFKPKLDPRFPELGRKVCPISVPCGLHIIGTERHESRRIDNQLRGRAGRQGDPGSSRFFLSLEDDLLKLFMPDWMLKMLDKHGFEASGQALEMKQLTKGIEKAQRKVEERNFATRKSLLEWDEPMDYQRKAFYDARQDVLESPDLRDRILNMIDQGIEEAAGRFLARDYPAQCIADWCRDELSLEVDADEFERTGPDQLQNRIRQLANDEARDTIRRSIGEYIDEAQPSESWDIGGVQGWAQRSFKASISKNQLRQMDADEIMELLFEVAADFFDRAPLEAVVKLAEPEYPYTALASWARKQFDVEIETSELVNASKEEVTEKLRSDVQQKYRRREIAYPIEYTIARTLAIAGQDPGQVVAYLIAWANAKFALNWQPEDLVGKDIQQVHDELLKINEAYFEEGKLEEEIDQAMSKHAGQALVEWAAGRFGPAWNEQRFMAAEEDQRRDLLIDVGQRMLRWELAMLEQRVVLQLYDQSWKDHLLEMDRLELAIKHRPLAGDQTHPQSQFAIEGRDLFNQMWERLRERIVGVILKLHAGPARDAEAAPQERQMTLKHADATNAGFSGASADQEAAMKAQGAPKKAETIRRDQPKVRRNDPCPCGSGKKYKQCCGKNAAA